jgi:hypothetical protein
MGFVSYAISVASGRCSARVRNKPRKDADGNKRPKVAIRDDSSRDDGRITQNVQETDQGRSLGLTQP